MKLIVNKNDSGKTRELIKYSLDTGVPIFALYDGKADSLKVKSLSYFGRPVHVVTARDLSHTDYKGDVLVDDLEKAFQPCLQIL